ncbi:MAG: hypothetical protein K9L56_15245 [Clostridiales bacterium]|nr:hypothetical protein [Clostridiales bacterium]
MVKIDIEFPNSCMDCPFYNINVGKVNGNEVIYYTCHLRYIPADYYKEGQIYNRDRYKDCKLIKEENNE